MTEPLKNRDTCDARPTGLPFFHSWGGIYVLVLFLFAIYVALLVILERAFS